MEDRKILAVDARTIADSTNALSNRIYKEIRELSKEGVCELEWGLFMHSSTLIEKVKKELEEAGYNIEFEYENDDTSKLRGMSIRW